MSGVVAAGHPLTAEAGAEVLRAGGNAVDAAVCAALASFAVESPLTGFGAGGFMMVHRGGETTLLDFFVAAPGRDGTARGAELVPVPVHFDAETVQTFYVGPVSCGVPGTATGLEEALRRFGSVPLAELVKPGVRLAREGAPVNAEQAYILDILEPIHARLEGTRELYAPAGRPLRKGDVFCFAELAEALERFGAEGAEPFCRGEVAAALSEYVLEHGGTLGPEDLATYETIEREPVRTSFRGTEVLTNPPPSSGGTLIAYCLDMLERLGESSGPEQLVEAMGAANDARGDLLGSTTHISVLDRDGMCANVTCSNGSGSGVLVPGTGVILNNMLGEEDLNPHGFHSIAPGRRVTSMMAPTVVLRDGEIEMGLGSAGSNRIRSAILQTIVRAVEQGMGAGEAVRAPRLHFEQGVVQAEPGIDEAALARIEARGVPVLRRPEINLFFGGTQAVARDPLTGEVSGGGDPRRGGSVAIAMIDFEAEGLLDGVEDGAREDRLALLEQLASEGVSLEELREAVEAGRLTLLPVERGIAGDGPRYTPREIAELSGTKLDLLQRASAALGLPYPDPDERSLNEADLEAARRVKAFIEIGLPEDGIIQVARTIGMGTARMAEANRELTVRTLMQPGDTERDLALRFAAGAQYMLPLFEPTVLYAQRAHLLEQIRRDVIGAADLASGELGATTEVSVCFADLVGFTKLGEEIAPEELGLVAGRLEEMATAVAEPPVRLVKTIGDAAMLVSTDAETMTDAALRLVEASDEEGEEFPRLRAGIARGPALVQSGDYYGRSVNLASRITGVAKPGSVLVDKEAKQAAPDAFDYSYAGERRLKGFESRTKLYRVRRERGD